MVIAGDTIMVAVVFRSIGSTQRDTGRSNSDSFSTKKYQSMIKIEYVMLCNCRLLVLASIVLFLFFPFYSTIPIFFFRFSFDDLSWSRILLCSLRPLSSCMSDRSCCCFDGASHDNER